MLADDYKRWREDPAAFIEEALVNPETLEPFELTEAERQFLHYAGKTGPDGRLLYPEQVFSGPKKSGKTTLAAMRALYDAVITGGRYAEVNIYANDQEQAVSRVFQAAKRIIEASPLLMQEGPILLATKITFPRTGAVIEAHSSDYAGAAGGNPNLSLFDELWGYTTEASHRLFDECVPPPTRARACRLTVTYAGFSDESDLLEALYRRGLKGKQVAPDLYAGDGMLMLWTNKFTAPWQTEAWREQMRQQLRPHQYLRLIENRWVSSESSFIDMDWWDACTDRALAPVAIDRDLPVWVGLDASTKRDSTAIVAVTWDDDAKRVRLVWYRVFVPTRKDPIDFETMIEETVLNLAERYKLQRVVYDPFQMAATAQRLVKAGIRMEEYPQTVPRLTETSNNLYELIKARGLQVYRDKELRLAVQRCIAVENPRGWRIAKEKSSHKIDVVVALAMASLWATRQGQRPRSRPNIRSLDDPRPAQRLGRSRLSPLSEGARPIGQADGPWLSEDGQGRPVDDWVTLGDY